MKFAINGANVAALTNSLRIDDRIGERSTASFVVSSDVAANFEQGQFVEITKNQMLPPFTDPAWVLYNKATMLSSFVDKVSGSTVANPNTFKARTSSTLGNPTIPADWAERSQSEHDKITTLNGVSSSMSIGTNGYIAMYGFSYDLIAIVERKYNITLSGTTADKVTWLKANITKLTCNWHGWGSSPTGNKATLAIWDSNGSAWSTAGAPTNTTGAVAKVTSTSTSISIRIDTNGFAHWLAYAEASNGTIASTINTDYVELLVEAKVVAGVTVSDAVVTEPYTLMLSTTGANQYSNVYITAIPNTQYTFSVQNPNAQTVKALFYADTTYISSGYNAQGTGGTFTTPANCNRILVELTNATTIGTFTFTNPQLELGSTATPFEEYYTYFSGAVEKSSRKKVDGESGVFLHSVTCKDWHYLADKRIIAKVYVNSLAGDIIRDFITQKLGAEGVTVGLIQDGDIIQEAVFNYVPISRAIDAICERTGFIWYIDFDKKFYFVKRTTPFPAPWTVTSSDVLRGITVDNGNSKYRNTQYIKGGTDVTDPQTENFSGDTKRTTFNTGFKVAKVPTITLNTVPQTVGIRGLDTGKQWYWSKGENAISQDSSGTPLISTQTLSVTYQGEFSIVVISKDEGEITLRQTTENNSGINDDVADEPETSNREAAFQSAASKLGKFAVSGRQVKLRTRRTGLESGQLAILNIPEYEISNEQFLIENVSISDVQGNIFYDVLCVDGPELGSWTKMFETMATRGQSFVIRENISEDEVLITLQTFSESVAWTENVIKTVYACPIPSTTQYPSTTLYPC